MGVRIKKKLSEKDVLCPQSVKAWQAWLRLNHARSSGAWLLLQKKGSAKKSLTYAEALDVALCHGWIDGQKRSYNENSWLQRFTPPTPPKWLVEKEYGARGATHASWKNEESGTRADRSRQKRPLHRLTSPVRFFLNSNPMSRRKP